MKDARGSAFGSVAEFEKLYIPDGWEYLRNKQQRECLTGLFDRGIMVIDEDEELVWEQMRGARAYFDQTKIGAFNTRLQHVLDSADGPNPSRPIIDGRQTIVPYEYRCKYQEEL